MDLAHILHQSPTTNRAQAKPPHTHYPPPKPPPLDPRGAALSRAIQNADADILREVLASICRCSSESFTEASKLLLVPSVVAAAAAPTVKHINSNKKRKLNSTDEASERSSSLCSRYEVCETCETTFDVTENGPEACQTHDQDGR